MAIGIVRNFWIEIDVDGKKTKVAVGPKGKNGGFYLTIKCRENGKMSTRKVEILGRVRVSDGFLGLSASFPNGTVVADGIYGPELYFNSPR